MQSMKVAKKFDSEMKAYIENFVNKQDFRAIETPLKKNQAYKDEIKHKLYSMYSSQKLIKDMCGSISLINKYLTNEKVRYELENAFDHFERIKNQYMDSKGCWLDHIELNTKPWVLFGLSVDSLLTIYQIVLKCYENKEIDHAKNLLELLLIFAPTISSYWNALGFCFKEESLEMALDYYLISLQIDPHHVETYFYIAHTYLAMNNRNLAELQLEKLND